MGKGQIIRRESIPEYGGFDGLKWKDLTIDLHPPQTLEVYKVGIPINKDGTGGDVPGHETRYYTWSYDPGEELLTLIRKTQNSGHTVYISTDAARLLDRYGFTFGWVDR